MHTGIFVSINFAIADKKNNASVTSMIESLSYLVFVIFHFESIYRYDSFPFYLRFKLVNFSKE